MTNESIAQLNTAERALLSLLAKSLFGKECELSEEDQLAAIEESRNQGVFCLAADGTKLSDENRNSTVQKAYSGIRKNMEILSQHEYLHDIMTKSHIPYVVLKGAASAYYYQKPQLRMMGDVDFLVSPDDIDRATEALKAEGFTPWDEKHICHIVFKKDKIHLEMHHAPAGIPYGEAGERTKKYLSDAVSTAEQVTTAGVTFMNPSPFTHGLVMLLHMQHHLQSEGIGLRHLCDWAVFVDSFADGEFEAMFEKPLGEIGLWQFAKAISLTAIAVGLPYRDFMGDNKPLADALLCDIIHGGNFGRKDKNRVNEGLFISNRGKDGVKHSRIAQFARSVNRIIYTNWPLAEKVKILLPFGWLYYGTRRLIRELFGKREPMQFAKSFESSKSRKEMNKKLHLFEINPKEV